jgi:hypothetical protein
MRDYRSSIYTQPVPPKRPKYNQTSWLAVLRAEHRMLKQQAALDKALASAAVSGIGISHIHVDDFYCH